MALFASIFAACSMHDTEYARQCYEEGRVLRQNGEVVQAMECFVTATRCYTDDYCLLGRVYSNMANMCRQAEQHALAYEVYTLSSEQFAKTGDSLAYAYALNNMAWEQAVQGHKDSALLLVDSALSVCPDSAVEKKVLESVSAACLYVDEYDSALFYTAHMNTLYGRMLRAQAFAFLNRCDSALWYAEKVIDETSNPRYLDDAYYILAHCDSTAEVDDILNITSARTDVQRELEQEKTQLAQAIVVMRQGLDKKRYSIKGLVILLCGLLATGVVIIVVIFLIGRSKERELAKTCRILAHSNDLKNELHWDNYSEFCAICNERLFGLADKLQKRELSERDIRICVLVLLGLSYAQMADILYRAQNGIGKDKYLIAKKLGVTVKDLQTTLVSMACSKE